MYHARSVSFRCQFIEIAQFELPPEQPATPDDPEGGAPEGGAPKGPAKYYSDRIPIKYPCEDKVPVGVHCFVQLRRIQGVVYPGIFLRFVGDFKQVEVDCAVFVDALGDLHTRGPMIGARCASPSEALGLAGVRPWSQCLERSPHEFVVICHLAGIRISLNEPPEDSANKQADELPSRSGVDELEGAVGAMTLSNSEIGGLENGPIGQLPSGQTSTQTGGSE